MRSTMPGKSALTVTPCTAATVPIALSVAGHSSRWATIVVTASGGGCIAANCCRHGLELPELYECQSPQ